MDTAQTMEAAEAQLKSTSFDAVVADLRLTGVIGEEGLEILRYVKELSPKTVVLLMTGYGSPAIEAKARAMGADAYLEKPVKASNLISELVRLGVVPGD